MRHSFANRCTNFGAVDTAVRFWPWPVARSPVPVS
jgi:hypothetical protein